MSMASSSEAPTMYKRTSDKLTRSSYKSSSTLDSLLTDIVYRTDIASQCRCYCDCSMKEGAPCLPLIKQKGDYVSQGCSCDGDCNVIEGNHSVLPTGQTISTVPQGCSCKRDFSVNKEGEHLPHSDQKMSTLSQGCCCYSAFSVNKEGQLLPVTDQKVSTVSERSCCASDCLTKKASQSCYSKDLKVEKGIQCPTVSKSSRRRKNAHQERWAQYINTRVISTGCVDEAALCTLNGELMANVGMEGLTQEDVRLLVAYLRRPQDSFRTGFDLCGRKYMYLSGSTNNLRGRDVHDEMGIIVTKGKHTVFIGLSKNLPYLGECDFVLDKQTAFLEMVGY